LTRPRRGVLPGFGLSTGFTVFTLGLVVLIPLGAVVLEASTLTAAQAWALVTSPRALASYRISFGASAAAAAVNTVFGVLVAWVLARYRFPGRALVDALVDLPFALPTSVSGMALLAVYARTGWLGRVLYPLGVKTAF
jgi:sulfate transport system permease protein